jgi:transmembrane sensor
MREPLVFDLQPKIIAAERFNRRWSRTVIRVAAAVIVVLGVSVVWRSAEKRPAGPGVASATVYTSGTGQLDSVQLTDGTKVLLGPGSRLALNRDYGKRDRVVDLNGEAFFDVKHDGSRPFTVRAGAATIRDIGTAFVVRNTADQGVRVAVTSGSVVLQATSKPEQQGVVLRAGDRGLVDQRGIASAQRGRVTDEDIAFTSGRLVFDDATLDEVSHQLERWYGIKLRVVGNEFTGRHITAAFDGESAQQVLNVIGLTLGANIELNGDTAILRGSR